MLLAGLKAAAMGSVIGTSVPSLIALVIGVAALGEDFFVAVLIIFLPFLIGLVCAATGLVVVGLPITAWLKRRGEESRGAYLSGGLIGGAVVTLACCLLIFGGVFSAAILLAVFGALTGGATGHYWWRFARKEEVEGGTADLVEVFE